MEQNIKENKLQTKKYALTIAILTLILILITITVYQNNKANEIIQLAPQGPRQMMGYIIKTKQNDLIVIDGGTIDDTENLINTINENGGKVKAWFLTHLHDDHVGAFTQVAANTDIPIEKIYKSFNDYSWYEENEPDRKEFAKTCLEVLESERIKDNVEEVSLNQNITIDDVNIEILGIKNPEITENPGNEQSMVIKFNFCENSLLILGDTGINSSQKLLDTQKEKLESDIVQMAHHGQNGATEELYKTVNPEICLWPTIEWLWNNDAGNGYNTGPWKTIETRQWMQDLGVKTNYTAFENNEKIYVR